MYTLLNKQDGLLIKGSKADQTVNVKFRYLVHPVFCSCELDPRNLTHKVALHILSEDVHRMLKMKFPGQGCQKFEH